MERTSFVEATVMKLFPFLHFFFSVLLSLFLFGSVSLPLCLTHSLLSPSYAPLPFWPFLHNHLLQKTFIIHKNHVNDTKSHQLRKARKKLFNYLIEVWRLFGVMGGLKNNFHAGIEIRRELRWSFNRALGKKVAREVYCSFSCDWWSFNCHSWYK